MTSIEASREEVQRAVGRALALADSEERRSLADFEGALWLSMLDLGRCLVRLFLARQVARPRAAKYCHADRDWVLDVGKTRSTPVGTRFGKVEFSRPTGRAVDDPRAARDLPVDRELGLGSGFSLCVLVAMARLSAQMAFAPARGNFRDTYGWAPSPRAVLRMVDSLGIEAKTFLVEAPAPEGDGEILVIEVDAKGAPMLTPETYARRARPHQKQKGTKRAARRARRKRWGRKRKAAGRKSKNAKMAVLAAIYTLRKTPKGTEGPINKKVLATFEGYDAAFEWVSREAKKRGYGTKRTLFYADGADHIWRLQEKFFPLAEVCLDECHVLEKIWKTGATIFGEREQELKSWVEVQAARLRRGAIQAIIDGLNEQLSGTPRTGPGNKGKRKQLVKTIKHFSKHKARMQYAKRRKEDLPTATGVIEGAVRNVAGVRVDGPGMHWGSARAERVLHLRCILVNGDWDAFVRSLAGKPQVRLAAQPERAVTHLAKAA